jgi:hypothetical protein
MLLLSWQLSGLEILIHVMRIYPFITSDIDPK